MRTVPYGTELERELCRSFAVAHGIEDGMMLRQMDRMARGANAAIAKD